MPGTVSVTVNVCPWFIIPESNLVAPEGTLIDVTVCCSASRSLHTMVLFTPTTTVMIEGWKFSDSLLPTPYGMVIRFVEL